MGSKIHLGGNRGSPNWDFVSPNDPLELGGSKGAMPQQAWGDSGLFVGGVIQLGARPALAEGVRRRMPGSQNGARAAGARGSAGRRCCSRSR